MKTYNQKDEDDKKELKKLKAKDWQVELLKLNPDYVFWGPHEDYMWKEGGGWDSAQFFKSWKEFGPWALDDMNEIVHFYFEIERDNKECDACGGECYAPDAARISNAFYQHSCPSDMEYWSNKITQDELDALWDAGRLGNHNRKKTNKKPTVDEVNEAQSKRMMETDYNHDAINRWILIEARCKRLGFKLHCEDCDGGGRTYTSPEAHVNLVLWVLHPRKGCSRGVEVRITKKDLPSVMDFLIEARTRNTNRFSKIKKI